MDLFITALCLFIIMFFTMSLIFTISIIIVVVLINLQTIDDNNKTKEFEENFYKRKQKSNINDFYNRNRKL